MQTRQPFREDDQIRRLVKKVESELRDSIVPISLTKLNAFERRQVHRYFDRNQAIMTKTYKIQDDEYELRIYPVGNLRRYADEKADEAIRTGQKVTLPHMSSYERFVIHEALKSKEAVKVASFGEGDDRHIEIEPNIFGRGLKKIIKKIKLF